MEGEIDEAGQPERDGAGRFAKGSSGNPYGRPRKLAQRHRMPMHNVSAIIDVAEMPVEMTTRENGRAVTTETTAYRAALTKVAQLALNGDMRAMKMFLDHARDAALANRYHSEFVKMLLERDREEDEMIRKILERFPKPENGGVYHPLEDGSIVPWKWAESLRKLDQIDQIEAREAELTRRENALKLREQGFGST